MKKYIYGILTVLLCGAALPIQAEAQKENEVKPVVIIGSGIGALTSSVYLQRAGIPTLVIEGQTPGGAISQSPSVHNWPGELEISGEELVEKVRNQALQNGAEIVSEEVTDVDFSKRPLKVTTRDVFDTKKVRTIEARSVIVAMGSMPRLLGVPGESGEKGYWTKGVYSCAVCDGGLYKDRTVAVIGGGDSAVIEADYLSNIAKKVYLVLRSGDFRSVEVLRKNKLIEKKNVEVLYNTKVSEIKGDGHQVTHLNLSTEKELQVDGVFVAIGATPNSNIFEGQLELDKQGYIVLKEGQKTSQQGVFAIGDVVDPFFKQAISASGDGAKAALQVEHYLATQPVGSPVRGSPHVKLASSGEAIEVTSTDEFYAQVNDSSTPLLVDFYSPFCGPCRQLSSKIDAAAAKYQGKVRVIKVNVTQFSDLAGSYNVYAVPTVMLFQDGKVTDQGTGLEKGEKILDKLESIGQ